MYCINTETDELFFFDDDQTPPSNLTVITDPRPSMDHVFIYGVWTLVEDPTSLDYILNRRDQEIMRVEDLLKRNEKKQRSPIIKSYMDQLREIENNENPAAVLSGILNNKPLEVIT